MQRTKWFSPYDGERRIGSVISVGPTEATVNLTLAGNGEKSWFFGSGLSGGEVDDYIFIDVGKTTVLGRLVKVWLEGGERLSVDSLTTPPSVNHPIGLIHLLISIDSSSGKSLKGIAQYPKLGSQVYSANPLLVAYLMAKPEEHETLYLDFAHHPSDKKVEIGASPEKLFARHCAVLGATGGGKSYTISTLVEQTINQSGKAILIDPTGEYSDLPCESYYVGNHPSATLANSLSYPHYMFSDSDMRAFLRPSAQSQAPKLEAAIQSQKIVKLIQDIQNHGLNVSNGLLLKAGQSKAPFEGCVNYFAAQLEGAPWSFGNLADQVVNECIWPSGGTASTPNNTIWGGRADNDVGFCLNLISRLKAYSQNHFLKWMLDPDPRLQNVPAMLDGFVTGPSKVIRIDLSALPYEAHSRELFVNALGRKLMSLARGGRVTRDQPLLVFIDEAHQFLNKNIGEEASTISLDSFANIAKEGRKYGLNVVIATQRPRDIPEDVLSQIGTLIVHRLTNQHDQEMVRRSVGGIDQKLAGFLPALSQGEAILLGVDFPFPMTVKIKRPTFEPNSKSGEYSSYWRSSQSADDLIGY